MIEQVDKMESWQNFIFMTWGGDVRASWWNCKLMKMQVDQMESWQNFLFMKGRRDEADSSM